MTDLRDQLADLIGGSHALASADRILDAGWLPPRNTHRTRAKAVCHPLRPVEARGLCKGCYGHAWSTRTLDQHPVVRRHVPRSQFIDTYELMRAEGATRRHIAERLGMTIDGLTQAYRRAVAAGALTPDRRRTA